MKKLISMLLTLVMVFGTATFVGCSDPDIDPNRTQLYVGLKESGLGSEWMYELKYKFEETHPEIQVMIDVKNEEYNGDKVLANIKYGREDVYFLNQAPYYDFVSLNGGSDYLADLTDVVTAGGENSIWARANKESISYYNVGTEDKPEIYGLPFSESNWCITYDKDLFKDKDLYSLDGYAGLDCVVGTDDDNYGPDGKEGTFDDGLPATWEDFKLLLIEMTSQGITPFTWTGKWSDYRAKSIASIVASYEGAADYMLRYNFNGEHDELGEINEQNGYKLADSEGVKAAITVAKHITSDSKFYSSRTTNTTLDHSQAHHEYLVSRTGDSPIAFLFEATWWEYEAKGIFEDMRTKYGAGNGYGERNLGMFPFPKFIGTEGIKNQTNTKTTYAATISTAPGMACVNKNSDIVDVAKEFVQYALSPEACAIYTATTGNTAPYKYDMTEQQLANLTPLQKDIFNQRESEDVEFARGATKNNLQMFSGNYFESWTLKSYNADTKETYSDPLLTFQKNPNMTVAQYIEGIRNIYNSTTWQEMYDRVY